LIHFFCSLSSSDFDIIGTTPPEAGPHGRTAYYSGWATHDPMMVGRPPNHQKQEVRIEDQWVVLVVENQRKEEHQILHLVAEMIRASCFLLMETSRVGCC
jgi:hypothetical protein